MPPTQKTYMPLAAMGKTPIEQCSYILANKLRCWRAADNLVMETIPDPTESDENATRIIQYQFCNQHTAIQQSVDAQQIAQEHYVDSAQAKLENPTPTTPTPVSKPETTPSAPAGGPIPLHEQMAQILGQNGQENQNPNPNPNPVTIENTTPPAETHPEEPKS